MTFAVGGVSGLIAGEVPLEKVLDRLRLDRPVFHSEADLQHSFARALWGSLPRCGPGWRYGSRIAAGGRREYLDLLCWGPSGRTAIEFKYYTAYWAGTAGSPPEEYALRSHGARDLGRRGFVFDIARLERFGSRSAQNGLALLITNEPGLWSPPKAGSKVTRDQDFRIHEGRTLSGELLWGGGDYERNARVFGGSYFLRWQPYSLQGGTHGEFRYLAVFTGAEGQGPTR